jgi:hypothetical protein
MLKLTFTVFFLIYQVSSDEIAPSQTKLSCDEILENDHWYYVKYLRTCNVGENIELKEAGAVFEGDQDFTSKRTEKSRFCLKKYLRSFQI